MFAIASSGRTDTKRIRTWRKRLVAASCLLMFLAVIWFVGGRGDQRLVGRWRLVVPGESSQRAILELSRWGTGTFFNANENKSYLLLWETKGDELKFRPFSDSSDRWLWQEFAYYYARLKDFRLTMPFQARRMRVITSHTICLDANAHAPSFPLGTLAWTLERDEFLRLLRVRPK